MKLKYLLPCILFFAACNWQKKNTNTTTEIIQIFDRAVVPEKLRNFVANTLPQYQIPDTTDYIKSWWSFYERGSIPYYATVDINNDRKPDHALLLKGNKKLELMLFSDSANTFSVWKYNHAIENFTDTVIEIQYGILIEAPGRTDCVVNGEDKSLVLASNGFALMNYEFKDRIFYIEHDSIKVFKVR